MSFVEIAAADGGTFKAYLATPPGGSGPGVLLISAVYGINEEMRTLAAHYAEIGYVVLCPDLFWRLEPGVELSERVEAERHRAHDLLSRYDLSGGVEDLKVVLAKLRSLPSCTGSVGSVGYCLGGLLAYHLATQSDIDCSVGYYAVGIEKVLDAAGGIRRPLMLHVGALDQYDTPDAQKAVRAGLGGNPLVTIHTYDDADHAFARVGGLHYNEKATKLANIRTDEFLRKSLLG